MEPVILIMARMVFQVVIFTYRPSSFHKEYLKSSGMKAGKSSKFYLKLHVHVSSFVSHYIYM